MFKKFVIVLMLLITPFAQARAVLICSMMNGQAVERCACPEKTDHSQRMRRDAPEGACCTVVVEVSNKEFAGVSAERPVLKRANDVPEVAFLSAPAVLASTSVAGVRSHPPFEDFKPAQSRLYLLTARLRL